MFKQIKDFFNWKKNPHTVFYLAIPIAVIGFGSHMMVAYLKWQESGDLVYTYIIIGAIALLVFGLWPVRKQLKNLL